MNYMGGKGRIAKYICPIIQKLIDNNNITHYYEPFVGGANIIDKIRCEFKYGSDLNKYLIALLKHVQDGNSLIEDIDKDMYNRARKDWRIGSSNEFEDWQIGNIGWLCSFSGRGFDGGYSHHGIEKKKDGTTKKRYYYQERKDNLLKQAIQPYFKDIVFSSHDYSKSIFYSPSLIYCDPPYQNAKQFANSRSFDYEKFWNWCRENSKNNILLVSELNAPDDFEVIWETPVTRSIKASDKTQTIEKLFQIKN